MNNELRPEAVYPKYPPYHTGKNLEEYFYNWWVNNTPNITRKYIDIFWTNIYCNEIFSNIKGYDLNKSLRFIPPNDSYFTICQNDDGPGYELPEDTLIFASGGNNIGKNTIPIPLVCSPISNLINIDKDIFCSFIGSDTHEIRNKIISKWKDNDKFVIECKNWSINVNEKEFERFKDVTSRSKFTLCPRGYGKTSFRLYEAIQLGSVPVYISDEHFLPWKDEINWNDFCVIISENDIDNLENILSKYSDDDINKMIIYGQSLYERYFSLQGVCERIIDILTSKIDIRTMVMHCKKLTERKESITQQFSDIFSNWSFYEYYDADNLTSKDINEFYYPKQKDPTRWRMKVSRHSLNALSYHNHKLTRAEISLTTKFGKAFQMLSKYNEDMFLLFEDDVVLCDDFKNKFKTYLNNTPDDWDAIYFGECVNLHIDNVEPEKTAYLKSHPASRGLAALLIKKKALSDLASNWFPFNLVSDWEISYHHRLFNHKVYWWEPTLVKQGSEISKFKSTLRYTNPKIDVTYVTYLNGAFLEMTKNMLLSYHKNVKSGKMIVICICPIVKNELDDFVNSLNDGRITVEYRLSSNGQDIINYDNGEFYNLSNEKFKVFLEKLKIHDCVYFCDSDIVFLNDPLEHIMEFEDDIIFQQDMPLSSNKNNYGNNWICTGQMFAYNRPNVIDFFERVMSNSLSCENDQTNLKLYLNRYGKTIFDYPFVRLNVFDPYRIMNGYDAFEGNWVKSKPNIISIHANYRIGLRNKIDTLKKYNLWLLN